MSPSANYPRRVENTSLYVPHDYLAGAPAGGHAKAVRRHRHGPEVADLPLEAADLRPRLGVPEAHRPVVADGHEAAAVRRERQALEVLLAGLARGRLLRTGHVPDAQR